jgi:trehalose 6-phosphate phosphatase
VTAGRPDSIGAGAAWATARRRIVELARTPGPLLVVSDFDGTLAPITMDPTASRILPLARVALRRLARVAERRPDRLRVVVLSGRTALDVAGRVRVGGVRYLGNHGLEGGPLARRGRAERLAVALSPGLGRHAGPASRIGDAVGVRLGRPDWLFVEQKGPSVAFHFRAAPDADAAREALLAAIDDVETALGRHGFARLEGRRVVELGPAGAGHKGAAVARLLRAERPAAAVMIGDDRSDAEAFAVIREARHTGRLVDGLALGVHGAAETPPEVLEWADVVLGAPRDAARALSLLATELDRDQTGAPAGAAVSPAGSTRRA